MSVWKTIRLVVQISQNCNKSLKSWRQSLDSYRRSTCNTLGKFSLCASCVAIVDFPAQAVPQTKITSGTRWWWNLAEQKRSNLVICLIYCCTWYNNLEWTFVNLDSWKKLTKAIWGRVWRSSHDMPKQLALSQMHYASTYVHVWTSEFKFQSFTSFIHWINNRL